MNEANEHLGELLFGLIGLQTGILSASVLDEAGDRWIEEESSSIGCVLVGMGSLTTADREAIENLRDRLVARCGGSVERALAALWPSGPAANQAGWAQDLIGGVEETRAAAPADSDEDSSGRASDDDEFVLSPEPCLRYVVLRPLDRGGLGEVHVARDEELDRDVALKQLRQSFVNDPATRSRFLREAQITSRLEHPGVVPVHGMGHDERGCPFYVMRLVDGETLKQALQRHYEAGISPGWYGSVEFRKLVGALVDVCHTLHFAHSRDVVHRDVKPANILLGPYGETLLVDWGLAKLLKPASTSPPQPDSEHDTPEAGPGYSPDVAPTTPLPPAEADSLLEGEALTMPFAGSEESRDGDSMAKTAEGTAMGTPQYMSPEQARGTLDVIGPATDVYGVGATLYAVLTGKAPFDGTSLESVSRKIKAGDFEPPIRTRPEVPPALDAICRKAMALEPHDRFPSANDLAEALEHWLADIAIPGIHEPVSARLSRWERQNRVLIRLGGLALGILTITAIVSAFVVNSARRSEGQQRTLAERSNRSLRELSVRLSLRDGLARCNAGELQEGLLAMVDGLEVAPPDSESELESIVRSNLGSWGQRLLELNTYVMTPGKTRGVLSPDGTRLATASDGGSARIWDVETSQPITEPLRHEGDVNWAAFSPDGTRLATAGSDEFARVWDARSGALQREFKHQDSLDQVRFSPDGRYLITACEDGLARVWDVSSDSLRPIARCAHRDEVVWLDVDPKGRWFATASSDRTARVWDLKTGLAVSPPMTFPGKVRRVAFSPDGNRLVVVGEARQADLWTLEPPTGAPMVLSMADFSTCAGFSKDGKRLVIGARDGFARVWSAETGERIGPTVRHDGSVVDASFGAGDRLIATAGHDNTARIWHSETGRQVGMPLIHRDWVYSAQFSADGNRVATASRDASARVWKLGHESELPATLRFNQRVSSAAASRDGKRLAVGLRSGQIILCDPSRMVQLELSPRHEQNVTGLAFSENGAVFASSSWDHTARLWSAQTGNALGPPLPHDSAVLGVAITPNGDRIVTSTFAGAIQVWDPRTGQRTAPAIEGGKSILAVTFSQDATRIYSGGSDGMVRIWDTGTGEMVAPPLKHEGEVVDIDVSPNGRWIVTVAQDNQARVWDAATGQRVGQVLRHRGAVISASFSRDSRWLITASQDKTSRLWAVPRGIRVGPPFEHPRAVDHAVIGGGDRYAFTVDAGGTLYRWPLPQSATGTPDEIRAWIQAHTGTGRDETGSTYALSLEEWKGLRQAATPSAPISSTSAASR